MKSDVASDLPKKTEQVLFCRLTKEQRKLYEKFIEGPEVRGILDGRRNALGGIDGVRKICNHPDLMLREELHDVRRVSFFFIYLFIIIIIIIFGEVCVKCIPLRLTCLNNHLETGLRLCGKVWENASPKSSAGHVASPRTPVPCVLPNTSNVRHS
jgi:SNF2 family DNA or RNA helicase